MKTDKLLTREELNAIIADLPGVIDNLSRELIPRVFDSVNLSLAMTPTSDRIVRIMMSAFSDGIEIHVTGLNGFQFIHSMAPRLSLDRNNEVMLVSDGNQCPLKRVLIDAIRGLVAWNEKYPDGNDEV